jgi:hypothetical protein
MSINLGGLTTKGVAAFNALRAVNSAASLFQAMGQLLLLANTAYDSLSIVMSVIDLVTFDPSDLLELREQLPEVEDFFKQVDLPNKLVSKEAKFKFNPRGKLGKILEVVKMFQNVQEYVGEFGAATVAKLLGFEPTEMEMAYHGIDAIFFHPELKKYLIIEAKGGGATLNRGSNPKQMTHRWIEKNLDKAIQKNKGYGGNQKAEAELIEDQIKLGNQFIAGVVSLDLNSTRKSEIKFGFQFYEPGDKGPFKQWTGF